MKSFSILLKKELNSYLHSILSYIFIVIFLVIITWVSFQSFFVVAQANMRTFFSLIPWFFLFFIPALAMRTWSDEKRSGTIENLLTLPYSEWQIIFAKFLSGAFYIFIVLLFSLPLPITISFIGHLDWGQVFGQYLAAFFLALTIFSLGQWISSLTKNQIVSFIITIAITFIFILMGIGFFTRSSSYIGGILQNISMLYHYQNLSRGVIALRDVVYFATAILLCLYLNALSLYRRHWK